MTLPGLMRIAGERLGAGVPYLSADPRLVEKWRDRLADVPGIKIGIAWQGNPAYARDWNRSFPLAKLAPLASLPDTHLVVLQKGTAREHLAAVAADWRWGIIGEDNPWYPTLRAFRQPTRGDWQTVFAQIALRAEVPLPLRSVTDR